MIDPELARRHASMPAAWQTVRAGQAAAPEFGERTVETSVRRKRGALLLAAAAAIAGATVLVLLAVGVLPRASGPAVHKASTRPPVRHASAKRARPRAQLTPSAPARPPDVTKRRIARPTAVAPPATAKTGAPIATTTTPPARAKSHVQPRRRAAPPAAFAPPASAKAGAPAAAGTTPAAQAKSHVRPHRRPQPRAHKSVAPFTPRPETFVWTSVPGATEYHIAFFKGDRTILVRRTRTARLTVPGKWRYAGKAETFAPGRYRWYVWFARGRQSGGLVAISTIVIRRGGPHSHRARHP
jgi:hypothetical protein